MRPTEGKRSRRGEKEAGESAKRGCQSNYTVHDLPLDDMLVKLSYHSLDHVNKDGKPCHGSADPTALPRYHGAAQLSNIIKEWVVTQYRMGNTSRRSGTAHPITKLTFVWLALTGESAFMDMPVEDSTTHNLKNVHLRKQKRQFT